MSFKTLFSGWLLALLAAGSAGFACGDDGGSQAGEGGATTTF